MESRKSGVRRRRRFLAGLAVVVTFLALTATGGAASSSGNVEVSSVGLLRPVQPPVTPDTDVTYTLRFRNRTDGPITWGPVTGFGAPAGTTLVSRANVSGFTLAAGEVKDATLTVHVPTLPNGTVLRVRPHVTRGGTAVPLDDPGFVDYVVSSSSVDPATAVSITSARTSTWPDLQISGVVTTGGSAYASQAVALWRRIGTTNTKVATVTTNSSGHLSRVVHPSRAATYWWAAGSTLSPRRTTQVRPLLSQYRSTATPKVGHAVTIHGRTTPATAGTPVRLQQRKSGHWTTIRSTTVAATSAHVVSKGAPYAFTITQSTAGTRTYRVVLPARGGRLAVQAPVLNVRWVR